MSVNIGFVNLPKFYKLHVRKKRCKNNITVTVKNSKTYYSGII